MQIWPIHANPFAKSVHLLLIDPDISRSLRQPSDVRLQSPVMRDPVLDLRSIVGANSPPTVHRLSSESMRCRPVAKPVTSLSPRCLSLAKRSTAVAEA